MDAICLLVAGAIRTSLPGPEFTLAWQHSVEKIRWEERYRVSEGKLVLGEARMEGTGAGMEPPPQAVLRNGQWTWDPQRTLAELTLTRFSPTEDYTLCWREGCRELGALVGAPAQAPTVVVRPCEAGPLGPVRPPR